jgi:hypothetical protein
VCLKSDNTDAAFQEVVSLDLYRILLCLRLCHAKSTRKIARKQPLVEHLHNAIHDRSIKVTTAIKESKRRVRDLQILFARLESMTDLNAEIIEAEEVVGQIVKQIHAFSLATNLGEALQTSILNPTLKIYLLEAISKLGQYYSTCDESGAPTSFLPSRVSCGYCRDPFYSSVA